LTRKIWRRLTAKPPIGRSPGPRKPICRCGPCWSIGKRRGDYRQTSSAAGRLTATSDRVTRLSAPAVIDAGRRRRHDRGLALWRRGRNANRPSFALPPSLIRFDPADVVSVGIGGRSRDMRLSRIVDGGARQCEAVSVDTARLPLRHGQIHRRRYPHRRRRSRPTAKRFSRFWTCR
jgi:hypothetical protein